MAGLLQLWRKIPRIGGNWGEDRWNDKHLTFSSKEFGKVVLPMRSGKGEEEGLGEYTHEESQLVQLLNGGQMSEWWFTAS